MFKDWGGCVDSNGVATISCISVVFSNLLSGILAFAGLAALAMFIMGGLKYITSAGDAKKLEGAKNNFVFGLIGLAVVLFSFVIMNIISQVTGTKCIINFANFGFGCQ